MQLELFQVALHSVSFLKVFISAAITAALIKTLRTACGSEDSAKQRDAPVIHESA
jgi:hypothetical protein